MFFPQLLGNQIHSCGADSRNASGHGHTAYREDQLQQTNAGRTDSAGNKNLKCSACEPQQQVHPGEH